MNNPNDNVGQNMEKFMIGKIKQEYPQWVENDGSCKRCEQYYQILKKLFVLENNSI